MRGDPHEASPGRRPEQRESDAIAGGRAEEGREGREGGDESSQSLRSTVAADLSDHHVSGDAGAQRRAGAGGEHLSRKQLADFSVEDVCAWLQGASASPLHWGVGSRSVAGSFCARGGCLCG